MVTVVRFTRTLAKATLPCLLAALVAPATADDVGQIKVVRGEVHVERAGRTLAGEVGLLLEAADTVKTGADGAAGITMRDDSRLSVGPNSILSLASFEYDTVSTRGRFDAELRRGTLAVVSGRIAKQSPPAMTVRTPNAVLGPRGTEFVVAADE